MTQIKEVFTKYEIARILGARALQVALDAPLLIKLEKEKLEEIKYDPLKVAEMEFNSGVLPITVTRPMPKMGKIKIKKEIDKEEDKEVEKKKVEEEKEIIEEGEIMELAKPEDESEEEKVEEASAEEGGV